MKHNVEQTNASIKEAEKQVEVAKQNGDQAAIDAAVAEVERLKKEARDNA